MDFFSNNIKFLRKKNKLTQGELGKNIDVSRTTVTGYETGLSKPDYKTLDKILKFFNINATELIEIDIEKKESGTGVERKRFSEASKWDKTQVIARANDWSTAYNLFNSNKDLSLLYKKLIDFGSALGIAEMQYNEIFTDTVQELLKNLGDVNPYKRDNSKFFEDNKELIKKVVSFVKTYDKSLEELNKAIEIIHNYKILNK